MDSFDHIRLPDIEIRHMTPADVTAGMRLKAIAGWNQTEQDWRSFLDANAGGCFVATYQDQVVGTVTSIVYAGTLAWIGMVLVDPAFRRQGIATRLTLQAMASLKAVPTIKLDATPAGKEVYDRLGFRDRYGLLRLTVDSMALPDDSERLPSPLTDDDLPGLAALDKGAFGADRLDFISSLAKANANTAWKIKGDRQVDGYCVGRPGSGFYQLGPIIASGLTDAIELTKAALRALGGQPVVIDVPLHQRRFLAWLADLGFKERRSFVRMVYGPDHCFDLPETVFAIAGPEFG